MGLKAKVVTAKVNGEPLKSNCVDEAKGTIVIVEVDGEPVKSNYVDEVEGRSSHL